MATPRSLLQAPRLRRRLSLLALLILLLSAISSPASPLAPQPAAAAPVAPTSTPTEEAVTPSVIPESLPLLFEPNAGRYDSAVQ